MKVYRALAYLVAVGVAFQVAVLGLLHGVNALAILAVALVAGLRVARAVGGRDEGAPVEVPAPVG
jgi:hypothetical protein